MTEKKDEIMEGLKTAMEAELTGHNFYKNAAQNVSDPKAKLAFSTMAEEEMAHFKYLRKQYQSILETGQFDFTRELVKSSKEQKENPIFNSEIKERIKECHYEVTVLTIGMKLELEAIRFYHSCADKVEDPEAKKFFNELADWEMGHYEAFDWELNHMKEDYWQANNFVPMA